MYSLIFHLIILVWRNVWLRHLALFGIGLGLFYLGSDWTKEATVYKDGPRIVDAASLSESNLEYDYLELSGFTDGFHYIYYFEPEYSTNENDVDLDKEVVMYYALLDEQQYDRSMNGDESKPAVLVRQVLRHDIDRTCAETDEGCLTSGELTLTGKLMPTLPKEEDADTFDKVIDEGLYTTDHKTLYFDADWRPATATNAGLTKYASWLWIALTAVSLPWTLSRRRKKAEAAMQPTEQITEEHQNPSPQM